MVRYIGKTREGLEAVRHLSKLGGTIEVTGVDKTIWNSLEGQNYIVYIKAVAPEGKVWKVNNRQSLLFEFDTNSTWVETGYDDELTEQERIEWMVYDCCL